MNVPPPVGKKHQVTSKGMTLVELLIVITIIVVLAALSSVGVGRFRSAARGAVCTSNLRQIGAAMIAYTTDNSGQLPPLGETPANSPNITRPWTAIIAGNKPNTQVYLAQVVDAKGKLGCSAGVWACPDCTIPGGNHAGYGAAEGAVLKALSKGNNVSLRLAQIPNPERTWLVGDAANIPKDLKTSWYAVWANPKQWANSHSPAARHAGKVNVCMVDGHVESLTMKELSAPENDYMMFKK